MFLSATGMLKSFFRSFLKDHPKLPQIIAKIEAIETRLAPLAAKLPAGWVNKLLVAANDLLGSPFDAAEIATVEAAAAEAAEIAKDVAEVAQELGALG